MANRLSVRWASLAGAYAPGIDDSAMSVVGPGYGSPLVFDVGALAQSWVDVPSENHGLLLKHSTTAKTKIQTSESLKVASRPSLVACYTPSD